MIQGPSAFNFYCDESTHLEKDGQPFLVLGLIRCTVDQTRTHSEAIRALKTKHGQKPYIEAKWTNVAPSNEALYLALIDYFFGNPDLRARVLVAPKENLDHQRFNQTFDDWYFKMYYQLLEKAVDWHRENRIYIDIKDNRSAAKVAILQEYLSNRLHDFDGKIVKRIQVIRSHESELLQLTDILIGAVNYANRASGSSTAKWGVVKRVQQHSGLTLASSTAPSARKFNLFHWRAQPARQQ